ncbi:enoyl-CoA hydratase/carnithine racemase [Frankia torreyi]|uniref:Enoyl-CoA hydratase/carnithine racemase n=1 Tax=Frankia torreyi TaxID=1856 RepID=A0A0D8BJL0_9ACTN|nr:MULTISPECIES: enoyl-CoA hydratase/isomerase family protein [Frankia]KJE24311.1 enoyl-CoA hydratase/carnithine racemase [Frankia torreyi]KQM06813.1 enoyl-CoA hydratase/carnithine racemase [Frankia sp. CpI1-P]
MNTPVPGPAAQPVGSDPLAATPSPVGVDLLAGLDGVGGRRVTDPEAVLADLQADPEAFSPLGGRPILVVDAASPAAIRVGELGRRLPCVCVAVAEDLRWVPDGVATCGFDILLTDEPGAPRPWVTAPDGIDAAVDALVAATAANPYAAVALVQLLRVSTGIDVRDAVVAESFAYSALQAGPEFAGWLARRRARQSARAAARPGLDPAAAASAAAVPPADSAPAADVATDPTAATTAAATTAAATAATAATVTAATAARAAAAPAVLIERDGAVLTVILNRPRVHNAVSISLRDGLVSAFGLAAADSELAEIRLAGTGPSFSSGGDLTEFGTMLDPVGAHAVRTTRSIPLGLLATGLPVTAYVHGLCIGAGAELPAFCGRVVAAPDTTFRLPEVAMGLVPGAGGTASIPRRIGPQRAAYLILSGLPIDAEQALAWGLVDEIAPRAVMPGASR